MVYSYRSANNYNCIPQALTKPGTLQQHVTNPVNTITGIACKTHNNLQKFVQANLSNLNPEHKAVKLTDPSPKD